EGKRFNLKLFLLLNACCGGVMVSGHLDRRDGSDSEKPFVFPDTLRRVSMDHSHLSYTSFMN
ncbi:hypothetical protein J6590_087928, partial [Homalodisca vitripennis]